MDAQTLTPNSFEVDGPYSELTDNMTNNTIFGNVTSVEKTGSTPVEIVLLSFIVPGISLLMSLFSYTGLGHAAILNFIMLMIFTICSDHSHLILCAIGCLVGTTMYLISKFKLTTYNENEKDLQSTEKIRILDLELSFKGGQIPFLTDFRGHLLLATVVSILAVDFEVFPSRFSKTTSFGWSVMDAGVGCFVSVHGMCSSEARGKHVTSLTKSLLSSVPLLLLGFLRLILTTAVNYHRSVSEYGVHWNFFFTLAITKMASSLLLKLFPFANSGIMALSLVVIHQWSLSFCGVSDLILSEDRNNLFEENKEGICSLPGFIVIYLQGVEVGKLFWTPRCKMRDWLRLLAILVTISSFGWIAMLILHNTVQRTSRRMANFPYCVWVVSLTSIQIAIHMVEHLTLCVFRSKKMLEETQTLNKPQSVVLQSSLLWRAINYNGLFYFLLANVLTGIVNMSIDTDNAPMFQSLTILFVYVYTLSITVILFLKYSIQFKFW